MRALVIGATGRVGSAFVEQALAAGHEVTVLVRDPARVDLTHRGLTVVKCDVLDAPALAAAYRAGSWDALVDVVGADPLKPSTLVTDAAAALVPLATAAGTPRYLGITGTAQMPKTLLGRISSLVLRLTPVRHGARDHDGAFAIVRASSLDWFLVGCPWIKDGPTVGAYRRSRVFPGGMRTIHPGDVAGRLFEEFERPSVHKGIEGIWY